MRERYEEDRQPGDPEFEETPAILNGIANFLKLQGFFIAHLAIEPETSEELIANSVHAAERVPAWMEMQVFEVSERPFHQFALGCAQLLAEQRKVIERIVEEQVEDPEEIERTLAICPIPESAEGEETVGLFARTWVALQGNFRATVLLARDLDEWIDEELERRREAGLEDEWGEYVNLEDDDEDDDEEE